MATYAKDSEKMLAELHMLVASMRVALDELVEGK
jgi:hypothetical protein